MGKKILLVHNYYQIPGGEDTVVNNEMKMLEENGNKVFLYTRDNSELKRMSILRKVLLPFAAIYNPKTAIDIKRLIKENKIDIVHVHNTLTLISPSVYYAAHSCNIPIVQTVHNFRLLCMGGAFYRDNHICEDCVSHGLKEAIKHRCYRNSLFQTLLCVISTSIHRSIGIYGKINYICLTKFNAEKLLLLKQIKSENVFIKPNFVDAEKNPMMTAKKDQFVFAGRLDKLKGVDFLLSAWAELGDNAPKLIVCGTGPMDEWCKKFVLQHKCNIELKGFLPNKEVRRILGESKAMILPTQWYEGFPMSIVEAFSVGTPVLCSNIGNAANIVINNLGEKFVFNSQSTKDFANKIKYIREYSLDSDFMKKINKQFSKNENYIALNSIYDTLISRCNK